MVHSTIYAKTVPARSGSSGRIRAFIALGLLHCDYSCGGNKRAHVCGLVTRVMVAAHQSSSGRGAITRSRAGGLERALMTAAPRMVGAVRCKRAGVRAVEPAGAQALEPAIRPCLPHGPHSGLHDSNARCAQASREFARAHVFCRATARSSALRRARARDYASDQICHFWTILSVCDIFGHVLLQCNSEENQGLSRWHGPCSVWAEPPGFARRSPGRHPGCAPRSARVAGPAASRSKTATAAASHRGRCVQRGAPVHSARSPACGGMDGWARAGKRLHSPERP